jgi:iron complex transport system ATP-binding protein
MQGRHPYGKSLCFETGDDVTIAKNALAQVGAEHLSDRWMDQISGGEKQRVILARALAQQPLLLLLDEPTLHLDIGAQVDLLETLRKLAAENRYTVVVVTHELVCRRVCGPSSAIAKRAMPAGRSAIQRLSA